MPKVKMSGIKSLLNLGRVVATKDSAGFVKVMTVKPHNPDQNRVPIVFMATSRYSSGFSVISIRPDISAGKVVSADCKSYVFGSDPYAWYVVENASDKSFDIYVYSHAWTYIYVGELIADLDRTNITYCEDFVTELPTSAVRIASEKIGGGA